MQLAVPVFIFEGGMPRHLPPKLRIEREAHPPEESVKGVLAHHTSVTRMRKPRMHGRPPHLSRSTVMRSKSFIPAQYFRAAKATRWFCLSLIVASLHGPLRSEE